MRPIFFNFISSLSLYRGSTKNIFLEMTKSILFFKKYTYHDKIVVQLKIKT